MKPRILVIGSHLGQHQLVMNQVLPQFFVELLRFGNTAPLFHGEENWIEAIILDNYFSSLPQGMSLKDCQPGENVGVIAFKKLQSLYPSATFFLFGLKGNRTLSREPKLVLMEPAINILPLELVDIVTKALKVRRAKSAPSPVH